MFWAPTFNWGFVIAGMTDFNKDPKDINTRLLGSKLKY